MKKYLLTIGSLLAVILMNGCCDSSKSCPAKDAANCPAKAPCVQEAAKTAQTTVAQKANASKICPEFEKLLVGSTWTPTFIKDQGNIPTPMEGGKYVVFMQFNKDGRVNGVAGDNLFGGSPTIQPNGAFDCKNFFSTKMAGPFGNYEMKFLQTLSSADKIEVKGDTIEFTKCSDLILSFKKIMPNQTTRAK